QSDLRLLAVLPDDLAASTAGRRELFRINHDYEVGKIAFTLGQCFPNRHALCTDGQTVTRALDVATGEDLSFFCPERRSDQKFRKGRQRTQTRVSRNLDQIL